MNTPPCADGTHDHAWVTQPVYAANAVSLDGDVEPLPVDGTVIRQCMVCGVKEITVARPGKPLVRRWARIPRWGFKGLPKDDERPRMEPQPLPAPPVELPPIDMTAWKLRRGRD
jgi:hypothetical protein